MSTGCADVVQYDEAAERHSSVLVIDKPISDISSTHSDAGLVAGVVVGVLVSVLCVSGLIVLAVYFGRRRRQQAANSTGEPFALIRKSQRRRHLICRNLIAATRC